ncbi:single-stranded-DNA-specific exonuclease RecJ [Candidatus Saccharibacteria bacterium]|nr:single-stranded-DNA-specific exonuclease RecJ [Candidatus Saccharibacteria bacterium]
MSKLFEELVRKRGVTREFLMPEYGKLASPFLLPDMKKAVERILTAVKEGEKVIVYGDYDADGVTASVVMNEILRLAGVEEGKVETMLPDRFTDGYGMSKKVVQRAKETGAKLVITVDCGSANKEIIQELLETGVETVVTDHHEVPAELPKAVAVVNPKRRDPAFLAQVDFEANIDKLMRLRDLAGVGVAFMVARAMVLSGAIPEGQEKWLLDLVLIGTICDSMKMSGENRILCYFGAKVLAKTRREGLKELLRVSGVRRLTSEAVGFQIGPRINAAGRMASAEIAFRLLETRSRIEAAQLAQELETLNKARRDEQGAAMKELRERVGSEEPVLVVDGGWHEGVLGIIAGRLVEEYRRPAFVLAEKEGLYKGSGRSFGEFNLAEALRACAGEIIGGGGHAGAAGVKVEKEKLGAFKERINEYYRSLGLQDQERFFMTEADIETGELGGFTLEFMAELRGLEPFGVGNEVPVFGLKEMFVLDKKLMGTDGQHLGLLVRGEDGKLMKLVAFNAPEKWREIRSGEREDLLVNVEENEWNGLKNVEGRILEVQGLA